jgi:plastocyanin
MVLLADHHQEGQIMNITSGLSAVAATGLILGLTACGSSQPPSASGTTGAMPATTASASQSASPSAPASTMSSSAAANASAAQPVVITIKDFEYQVPASVSPGAKITVKNADSQNHTVTSKQPGLFDAKASGGGGSATFTAPKKPGSYMFTCTFHGTMMGTLVVK